MKGDSRNAKEGDWDKTLIGGKPVPLVKNVMPTNIPIAGPLFLHAHFDLSAACDMQVEGQMHATTGVGISGDVRLAAKYKKAGFDVSRPDGKKPKFQFESKAPNFELSPRPYLKVEGKQQRIKGRCSLQPTAVLLLEHSVGAKLSVEPYVELDAKRASARDKWTLDAQAGVSVNAATDIEIFGRQVRKAKEYALFDVALTKPGDEMGTPPRIVGPAVPPKTGRAAKKSRSPACSMLASWVGRSRRPSPRRRRCRERCAACSGARRSSELSAGFSAGAPGVPPTSPLTRSDASDEEKSSGKWAGAYRAVRRAVRALNPSFRPSLLTTARVSLASLASLASFAALATLAAAASGCSSSSSKSGTDVATGGTNNGTAASVVATSAVSGSRLRVKSITGGGAREVVAFHDMERNEDCTFQRAESGRTRCYPTTVQANQSGLFTDAACKVPAYVAAAPACTDTVTYGVTISYTGNCSTGELSELRKLAAPTTPTYTLGPSGCAPARTAPPSPGGVTTVPLGDVVPWTSFVEGTEMVVPGPIVSEKIIVTADGAKQHLAFRDDKLGIECTFALMADGMTRCVPAAMEAPVLYSDASCSKAFAVNDYSNSGACSPSGAAAITANLWLEPSESQCGGIRNVFRLGTYDGTATGTSIYQWQFQSQGGSFPPQTTCSTAGQLGNYSSSFRLITDTLNASLPMTGRVGSGSDRLVPAFVWPPGSGTLVPGWHDTMNDVDCTFTLASDGKTRCLPVASTGAILFTDGTCTSPGRVAVLSDPSCIGVRRYAREVSTTCPPTTAIYSLGADAHDFMNVSVLTSTGQCGKVSQAGAAFDATVIESVAVRRGRPRRRVTRADLD